MAQTIKSYRVSADAPITHNGETRSLVEWCKCLDLNYHTVRMRFKRGKKTDELFLPTPAGFKKSETIVDYPSVFYTLNPETRVCLLRASDNNAKRMQGVIEEAIWEYVKGY